MSTKSKNLKTEFIQHHIARSPLPEGIMYIMYIKLSDEFCSQFRFNCQNGRQSNTQNALQTLSYFVLTTVASLKHLVMVNLAQ